MNWTGGRLQRHSKVNSNAQVKAQKHYFACARLRQSTKSSVPTPLPVVVTLDQHEISDHPFDQQGPGLTIDRKAFKHAVDKPSPSYQVTSRSHKTDVQRFLDISSPPLNTLEHVKRSLLKQSDWLGLAGARPPRLEYRSTAIPEQIGRRRKVTREDKHQQTRRAAQHKIEHHLIKPFAQVDNANTDQTSPSENVSIRIGSFIHQSQATKSHKPLKKPYSAVAESSSTEPMLLDIAEAQLSPAMTGSGKHYLEHVSKDNHLPSEFVDGQDVLDDDSLVPLEQARDFASFDELKRYSSSAKCAASQSGSVPKQLLQATPQSKFKPLQNTSSSLVNGKVVHGQEISSSAGNDHKIASITNKPPGFTDNTGDIVTPDEDAHRTIREINGADQEVRGLELFDAQTQASVTNLSLFEKLKGDGALHDDKGSDPRSSHGFRDISQRAIISSRQRRPLDIIERQVKLEERFGQPRACLNSSVQDQSGISVNHNMEHRQLPARVGRIPVISEDSSHPTTSFSSVAMKDIPQNIHRQSSRIEQSLVLSGHRRQGDENEAWMRDVFSTDFDKLKQRFSFTRAPIIKPNKQTQLQNRPFEDQYAGLDHSEWRKQSTRYSSDLSLPETIKTGFNTVLNVHSEPEQNFQQNGFMASETDFLSQMSPMSGYLDDCIVNLSTHNNAANTVRNFMSPLSVSPKRTATEAFGDSSYNLYDRNSPSEGNLASSSSPAVHRVPLITLDQPPLRPFPFDESRFVHGDTQTVSRPIWRYAKLSSPIQASANHRSLASQDHLGFNRTPHDQVTRLPLDYKSLRNSASQSRKVTHLDALRKMTQTASSDLSHQFSSPTKSSQHRVPLIARAPMGDIGTSRPDHQSFNALTPDQGIDTSRRFEFSMPSPSGAPVPTSSSSDVSTRRTARPFSKIPTNELQPFLFKQPHNTTAQYSHPSKRAESYRTPPAISLH